MATKTYTETGYINNTALIWEHGDISGPLPLYSSIADYTRDNPGWETADGSTAPIKVTLTYEYDHDASMDAILDHHTNNKEA